MQREGRGLHEGWPGLRRDEGDMGVEAWGMRSAVRLYLLTPSGPRAKYASPMMTSMMTATSA
jgi:hypothetical protein